MLRLMFIFMATISISLGSFKYGEHRMLIRMSNVTRNIRARGSISTGHKCIENRKNVNKKEVGKVAFHFIAISSDYVQGGRIGWHYSSPGKLDSEYIQKFMSKVGEQCEGIQLGIHKLSTGSVDWGSVIEKDSFFEDVIITSSMDQFISQISGSKDLTAYDVSKFLLSLTPTSHLKLQKLLYYAYSEYLLKTGKRLFQEPIVAFKYGPVVEDVFHKFRHNGSPRLTTRKIKNFIFMLSDQPLLLLSG